MAAFEVTKSWMYDHNEEDDVWEDDLLVQAYEQASKRVEEVLKSRMERKNSKDSENRMKKKCDTMKNSNNDSPNKESSESTVNEEWKKNQFCRCVYSEDAIEYEAQIIDINEDKGLCRVRYIGYDNEEEQLIVNLLPSNGNGARKIQQKAASTQMNGTPINEEEKTNATQLLIPPPAMLPSIPVKEDDALASMLMSWYMAGYHTGYFQGIKNRESQ